MKQIFTNINILNNVQRGPSDWVWILLFENLGVLLTLVIKQFEGLISNSVCFNTC